MKLGNLFLSLGLLAASGIAQATPFTQHFLYLFSADDGQKTPTHTHTWATFVEVTTEEGATPEVKTHSISWLPRNSDVNPLALGPQRGRNLPVAQAFMWAE